MRRDTGPVHTWLLALVLVLLLPWQPQAAAPLPRITLRQRQGEHRVFVDPDGRERIFHGSSAVVKGPPWVPDGDSFSSDISMAREDFEWMQSLGLNVLRLGVFWAGLEPTRGHYNETYLDQLERIVDLAGAHGVYVFLDMHQDGLSELFCGEGFPPWAIRRQHNAAMRFPAPFSPAFNDSQMYNEPVGSLGRIPRDSACGESHGPDYGQWTRETAGAYQAIYSNWDGLGDAFAAAWAKVAARFAHRPEILGLELINEPFAGDFYTDTINETNWMNSTLMIPWPNPDNADAKNLQPLFDRVNAAVRVFDDKVLLFFAGIIWDNYGAGFTAPPGGWDYANRSVLTYHYYNPPQTTVQLQFDSFNKSARRLQVSSRLSNTYHID
jgi:endoglycosylceramidase